MFFQMLLVYGVLGTVMGRRQTRVKRCHEDRSCIYYHITAEQTITRVVRKAGEITLDQEAGGKHGTMCGEAHILCFSRQY